VTVDPQTTIAFLSVLEAKMAGDAAVVIPVSPGVPNPAFTTDPFNGHSNATAYMVIQSVTIRNQLGHNLAASFVSNTGNEAIDGLTKVLVSAIMSSSALITGEPVKFIFLITFSDGSTAKFEMAPGQVDQAEYVEGSARDKNQNPIPDSSIVDPNTASNFIGEYFLPTNRT
jgi:hypothetical protein